MGELLRQLESLENRARAARKKTGKDDSRGTAAKQAGLAKQTVSGWFSRTSPRVPKDYDQLWRLVELYSHWAGEKPSRQ
ncbi:hypothetical protein [Amycolatopsis sp. NPDC049159]